MLKSRKSCDLGEFIQQLSELRTNKHKLIRTVKYPQLLIEGLKDLNQLVGMNTLKEEIIKIVQFVMTQAFTKNMSCKKAFEGHMPHSMLCGDPGTGKTTAAICLCKIWVSLGVLEGHKATKEESKPAEGGSDVASTVFIDIQRNVIETQKKKISRLELDTKLKEKNIDALKESLKSHNTRLNRLMRQINTKKRAWYKLGPERRKEANFLNNIYREMNQSIEESSKMISDPPLVELQKNGFFSCLALPLPPLMIQAPSDFQPETQPIVNENPEVVEIGASSSAPMEVEEKEDEWEEEVPPAELPFTIYSREDFVGKYVGHTAPQTLKALEKAKGHVVMIDEAYKLWHGGESSGDTFGLEALTVINEFMSNHPEDIVFIFAGYKELMQKTIFKAQPGLKRRCAWSFEIEHYGSKELCEIFKRQLDKHGWTVDPNFDLLSFFDKNENKFPNMGGDTERLALHCKTAHASSSFNKIVQGLAPEPYITEEMLDLAFNQVTNANQNTGQLEKESPAPLHLYM